MNVSNFDVKRKVKEELYAHVHKSVKLKQVLNHIISDLDFEISDSSGSGFTRWKGFTQTVVPKLVKMIKDYADDPSSKSMFYRYGSVVGERNPNKHAANAEVLGTLLSGIVDLIGLGGDVVSVRLANHHKQTMISKIRGIVEYLDLNISQFSQMAENVNNITADGDIDKLASAQKAQEKADNDSVNARSHDDIANAKVTQAVADNAKEQYERSKQRQLSDNINQLRDDVDQHTNIINDTIQRSNQ